MPFFSFFFSQKSNDIFRKDATLDPFLQTSFLHLLLHSVTQQRCGSGPSSAIKSGTAKKAEAFRTAGTFKLPTFVVTGLVKRNPETSSNYKAATRGSSLRGGEDYNRHQEERRKCTRTLPNFPS